MMDAQALLLDSLNARRDKYKAELKNCRDEFSEEAVHDFRVATRRLLALLDLLRALMPDAKVKKMRRNLKGQLDNLDELRDIQVMLAGISKNVNDVPSLQPFGDYLQNREKKLMRAARKEIKSLKTADLSKRIRKLGKAVAESLPNGPDLFRAVDESYAEVIRRYKRIDPSKPATIHHLRIAFKKFRYMVESIYPILEGFPQERLKRMHDYQTLMGDIQDMDIALRELAEFEKLAPANYDPNPLRTHYSQQHALVVSRYLEGGEEVFDFWRSASDQSFKKEK